MLITNNKTTTRQFKSEQALVGSIRHVQVQRNEECESQNAQRQDLNDDEPSITTQTTKTLNRRLPLVAINKQRVHTQL